MMQLWDEIRGKWAPFTSQEIGKKISSLNDTIEEAKDKVKAYNEKLSEAEKVQDDLTKVNKDLKEKIMKAGFRLQELKDTPLGVGPSGVAAMLLQARHAAGQRYLPTVEELAQSGSWVRQLARNVGPRWQQGPFAAEAQALLYNENLAKEAAVFGRGDVRQGALARVQALKADLMAKGVIQEDPAVKMLALMEGDGINVKPKMGP